ncbi:hypothetical protein CLV98_102485 [Dyadobacter jejuensis]|uniref:Uncharacterized protein n=1 Tax=Dyadobacter jejuensis TaxID=1082580 RepID=A0A316AQB7_9BACT|nr:hypothetical protein [Dyadobacter jejuensis]PWJ59651.1 hypothetical protein CLV98_102485 [Dyadobacter jejuensis]
MENTTTNWEKEALNSKLDSLHNLTMEAKEYYQKLLQSNNEVPYILGQLHREVSQLHLQVSQYEQNVGVLSNK